MRVLTVQQPWAKAIVAGWKPIENRRQLWKYRGPVAIHAGARWSDRGAESPLVTDAAERAGLPVGEFFNRRRVDEHGQESRIRHVQPTHFEFGSILGVVDLVDTHLAVPGCCDSPWGEQSNHHSDKIVHLVLENAREFAQPITGVVGKLGLWKPSDDLRARIMEWAA